MTLIRSIFSLFLIYSTVFLSLILFSCRGAQNTSSEAPPPAAPAVEGNDSQAPDNGAGFNVRLKSTTNYTYILHKGTGANTDDFSEACSLITADGLPASDITCIAETRELDLFFNGIGFRYNVPQNLCEYVSVKRPYFYNFQPSVGPTTVIDNRAGTTNKTYNAITALAGELKVGSVTKTSIYCDSDYSAESNPSYVQPSGGPNCCSGKYDLFTSSTDNIVSAPTLTSWGGKAANCLMGPAMQVDDHQTVATSGYPIPKIYDVLTAGLSEAYDVISPISQNLNTNVYAANYFNPADHISTGTGYPVAYAATGTAVATNPYHEFSCLNRFKEVKARIRILVREWNMISEFDIGAAGDPDSTGNEPNFGAPPINDYQDFKDIGDVLNVSYPKDTPF